LRRAKISSGLLMRSGWLARMCLSNSTMWLKSSQQTEHEGFWTCSIPNWFEAGLSGMAGLLLARDAIWHRMWGTLITQKLAATKSKISIHSITFPWTHRVVLKGALLVAATLTAAIRLRGEPITNTPRVIATIHDSIKLARMVLRTLNAD
jgi:hypothetical protein